MSYLESISPQLGNVDLLLIARIIAPVLIIVATALLLLVVESIARAVRGKAGLGLKGSVTITLMGTVLAALAALYSWAFLANSTGWKVVQLFSAQGPPRGSVPGAAPTWSGGALVIDHFAVFVTVLVTGILILASLNLMAYLEKRRLYRSELFPLILLSASGMMLLGMSRDLLITFIAIEIVSLPLYVLCGLDDRSQAGKEASLKYFLLGAFASGFFIYGAALVYGVAGNLNYAAIAQFAFSATEQSTILLVGCALVGAGLAFKLALVPLHAWVPDVYQGAPTPITAFMATGVKLGVFAAAMRLVIEVFNKLDPAAWQAGIAVLAALTMIIGNLLAIHQMSAKRLLAYSAIAHSGYLTVGLASGVPTMSTSIMVYLVSYCLSALGAFMLISYLSPEGQDDIYIDEMHELSKRAPVSAMAFTILLLSMAGFPLTLGFIGKLMVFTDAWRGGLYGLVILAVLMSVVSVYYYLRFVIAMYMQPRAPGAAELKPTRMPGSYVIAGIITVGLTLLFGVLPYALIAWTQQCTLGGL